MRPVTAMHKSIVNNNENTMAKQRVGQRLKSSIDLYVIEFAQFKSGWRD
jgi:hypothetical protein